MSSHDEGGLTPGSGEADARLVRFEATEGVARLTLNRPDAGNAMTPALIDDFAAAVDRVIGSGCTAVLISAEGPNFCVGADLKHLAQNTDRIGDELTAMANRFHDALARLTELPIPVVARVQGAAVGAGFGLLLAADYVFCAESARLSTGYARLGLSADAGVSFFLTRALGPRLARSLLMTARFVAASEALSLGLVDECCAPDDLSTAANAAARRFADGPTNAYAAIKRLTTEAAQGHALRDHLDREREEIVALAGTERFATAMTRYAGAREASSKPGSDS